MSGPSARELLRVGYQGEEELRLERLAILAARVEKMLALHSAGPLKAVCGHCYWDWPCPTVRMLNGEGE